MLSRCTAHMQRKGNHGNGRLTVKLGSAGDKRVSQHADFLGHDAIKLLPTLCAQFVFHLLGTARKPLRTDP